MPERASQKLYHIVREEEERRGVVNIPDGVVIASCDAKISVSLGSHLGSVLCLCGGLRVSLKG